MEEPKFKFEFSFVDVVKLIKGLQELPYKESSLTISYIQDSYYKQQQELELKAKQAKQSEEKATATKEIPKKN